MNTASRCKKASKFTIFMSALLLITQAAPAQEKNISTAVQRSALLSVGRQSDDQLTELLENLGYSIISDDKRAGGWSLGYRHPVLSRWSADIQYLQQGKIAPAVQGTLPVGKTTEQAAKEIAETMPRSGKGVTMVALYHQPIIKKLTLQAGLGAFVWQSERVATVDTSRYTNKSDGVSGMVQLGLSYPFTDNARFEANWQHIWMPDSAVDRLGLGIAIGF